MSTEKKMHNLKAENYVLFGRLAEDLSLRNSLSKSSEGLFQIDKEEPGCTGVFATKIR